MAFLGAPSFQLHGVRIESTLFANEHIFPPLLGGIQSFDIIKLFTLIFVFRKQPLPLEQILIEKAPESYTAAEISSKFTLLI